MWCVLVIEIKTERKKKGKKWTIFDFFLNVFIKFRTNHAFYYCIVFVFFFIFLFLILFLQHVTAATKPLNELKCCCDTFFWMPVGKIFILFEMKIYVICCAVRILKFIFEIQKKFFFNKVIKRQSDDDNVVGRSMKYNNFFPFENCRQVTV